MRIATLLKVLIALVIIVVAAAVIAVLVIDPNEYKDEIIATVEDQTGRDFSIDSDIGLELGLTPSFAVSGVRLANAEWGSQPDMLKVGEFAAEIALIPLIFGNLQINRLVLRDADILIETDAGNRSNLDFAGAKPEGDAGEGGADLPQINDVMIENATLTVIDGVQGKTTKLEIQRLAAAAESLSQPLEIELAATATLDDQPVEFGVAGEIGSPALLLDDGQSYPVDVEAAGLGLTVKIAGDIADPATARGLNLAIEVAGSDLQGLAPLAGDGLPAAGPVTLAAALKGDIDNATLENVAVKIGRTDIAGNASLDMRGKRPRLVANLSAVQIDLTELLPADTQTSDGQSAGQAETSDGTKAGEPEKVFSADPLPFDALNAFDAELDVDIASLVLSGATLSQTTATVALDNGALAIKPVTVTISQSAITGDLAVDTRSQPATVSLNMKAPQLDLGGLLREFADLDQLRGSGAVDVSLRGNGRSLAEIMAGLNGHTRLLMEQGEMKNDFLGKISGLTQTIGEAFGKKEWIVVDCIASDFEVANGIASSRINVINTELLLITTEGKVDLGAEKPELKVTPQSKGIDLSLAVPVNIGGSLANPTFAPDTLATAKKVGGIIGAIAFPPAAVLGLGELGGDDNPCLQTASTGSAPQEQSTEPASPVEEVTDTAKEAIEGVGEGLKKLFGN